MAIEMIQGGENMNSGSDPEQMSLMKRVLEKASEDRRREDIKLLHTIEEARRNGKEDFDVEEFAKYYRGDTLIGETVSEESSEIALESFMRDYYLQYKDINTVREYAIALNEETAQWE